MFCYFHPVVILCKVCLIPTQIVNIHIVLDLDISGTTAHVLCFYSSASAICRIHVSSVAHTLPNEVYSLKILLII